MFPPENYVPVNSLINGIEIFMPALEKPEETLQEVVDYTCPRCGATTAYSVAEGGLKCSHCGYYEPPEKKLVGKGAEEFEFTLDTLEYASHGWGEPRQELICHQCGAQTSISVGSLTRTCPFCGSNSVIQRESIQEVLRPRFLVPFNLKPVDCQKIAQGWLTKSWMIPKIVSGQAAFGDFKPIYLPYWTFDAVTNASWRAEVGHQVTERYYDHGDKTWKTRTRIEWRWESGNVQHFFDDLLVPGTKRLSHILLSQIGMFTTTDLIQYAPAYLAGLNAQAYDIGLGDSWETARTKMREKVRLECRNQASTSHIRNFSMSLDFKEESWRYILLPVYVNAYRYDNNIYRVMVNGQTGAIAGQRPVDWPKIWLAVAGLVAPGVVLGLIGLITVLLGGVGILISGIGFVTLLIGLMVSFNIVRSAQAMDDI